MLTQFFVWLNAAANALADVFLAPIAGLPGWLSATVIAVVTGLAMLLAFKYTSNQTAIRRTRDRIKANLLALSLFKDDVRVGLRCQAALLLGAVRLIALSLVPMLVMLVPMCLILGQLGLWYQARPLAIGEDAVVTVQLAQSKDKTLPEVHLENSQAVTPTIGPVRVPSKHMVCWTVAAAEPGFHELSFDVGGRTVTKQIAIGDGLMPTSIKRPAWSLTDVLLNPREHPFAADSPVQSIEIDFPQRSSWTAGTDSWLIYWFIVSLAAAFMARPLLKVNI